MVIGVVLAVVVAVGGVSCTLMLKPDGSGGSLTTMLVVVGNDGSMPIPEGSLVWHQLL